MQYFRFDLQPVADGIESVKRVVQQKGIEGVYGPLIENFTCNDKFFTAIDVTGGNKYDICYSFKQTKNLPYVEYIL